MSKQFNLEDLMNELQKPFEYKAVNNGNEFYRFRAENVSAYTEDVLVSIRSELGDIKMSKGKDPDKLVKSVMQENMRKAMGGFSKEECLRLLNTLQGFEINRLEDAVLHSIGEERRDMVQAITLRIMKDMCSELAEMIDKRETVASEDAKN
jgi:hypothetical protein